MQIFKKQMMHNAIAPQSPPDAQPIQEAAAHSG